MRANSDEKKKRASQRVAVLALHFIDYSVELVRELSQTRNVMFVYDASKAAREGELVEKRIGANVKLLRIHQKGLLLRISCVLRTIAALATYRPELIVAHEIPHAHAYFLYRCIRRLCPLFLIVHDPEPHKGQDTDTAKKASVFIDRQRRGATLLLVHGRFCASRLRSYVGKARIVEIRHGAILSDQPAGCATEGPFLMIGRMEEYKGLTTLLAVCQLMVLHGVKWPIRIVGAGPTLDSLRSKFQALEFISVETQFLKRSQFIAELRRASCVVLPYLDASQSGVACAALANGVPVIGSRVGGLPEIIQHGINGLLVSPGNSLELYSAMKLFNSDEELREKLCHGAAATQLSWHDAVRAIDETYAGLPWPGK